jgi:methylmalonyl-CoA mutase cobalamin-binding subunit
MEAYELTVNIILLCLAAPAHKALSQSVIKYLHPDDIKKISEEL